MNNVCRELFMDTPGTPTKIRKVDHQFDVQVMQHMLEGRLPPGKVGTCGYHGCGDIVMHFGSKAQKYYAKCCAEYVMIFL